MTKSNPLMIPAEPGYFVLYEGFAGPLSEAPVIAWYVSDGRRVLKRGSVIPITLDRRAYIDLDYDDPAEWAVLTPNGEVFNQSGETFPDIDAYFLQWQDWQDQAQEKREAHAKKRSRKAKAA